MLGWGNFVRFNLEEATSKRANRLSRKCMGRYLWKVKGLICAPQRLKWTDLSPNRFRFCRLASTLWQIRTKGYAPTSPMKSRLGGGWITETSISEEYCIAPSLLPLLPGYFGPTQRVVRELRVLAVFFSGPPKYVLTIARGVISGWWVI